MNDVIDNNRNVCKFVVATDIVNSVVVNASGREWTSADADTDSNFAFEGICVGHHGDILEVTSTASSGRHITRRALKNALWAENQVSGAFRCYASTNPNAPTSFTL